MLLELLTGGGGLAAAFARWTPAGEGKIHRRKLPRTLCWIFGIRGSRFVERTRLACCPRRLAGGAWAPLPVGLGNSRLGGVAGRVSGDSRANPDGLLIAVRSTAGGRRFSSISCLGTALPGGFTSRGPVFWPAPRRCSRLSLFHLAACRLTLSHSLARNSIFLSPTGCYAAGKSRWRARSARLTPEG
jgi:hypothetical protein